mmetsp:Transcript_5645/g.12002  ORF Transcript_5645/g.12002 Transcript_5645/m.12002 type:complete len:242 (+) Transcript_5645:1092-1817(+)
MEPPTIPEPAARRNLPETRKRDATNTLIATTTTTAAKHRCLGRRHVDHHRRPRRPVGNGERHFGYHDAEGTHPELRPQLVRPGVRGVRFLLPRPAIDRTGRGRQGKLCRVRPVDRQRPPPGPPRALRRRILLQRGRRSLHFPERPLVGLARPRDGGNLSGGNRLCPGHDLYPGGIHEAPDRHLYVRRLFRGRSPPVVRGLLLRQGPREARHGRHRPRPVQDEGHRSEGRRRGRKHQGQGKV